MHIILERAARRLAPGHHWALAAVAAAALLGFPAAHAGLRKDPPKGVSLAGAWQIDPVQSDDPEAVRAKMREQMQARREKMRERAGGFRGPSGDGGFPGGDGEDGATGGERTPPLPGGGPDAGGAGGGGMRHRGPPPDSDGALTRAERLDVEQSPGLLQFLTSEERLACTPGEKVSVSDRAGTGTRTCGWDGRAFIVRLERSRGPEREDRYELEPGGQKLIHTTKLSGDHVPEVSLRRVYERRSAAS
ncbi:MAG: hypothetical protein U1F11_03390 [Steroidobacteraceae bacterium]